MSAPASVPTAPAGPTRASRAGEVGALLAWALVVVGALLTAGFVDRGAAACASAFFLVLALLAAPAPAGHADRAALVAVAAAVTACVLTLIPLPEGLRAAIAPGPTSARSDLRALGLQGAWAPISVDVGGTVSELLLWAGAAAALLVLSRPEGPPLGARFAIGLLAGLHGVAWIDWAVGLRVFPLTTIQDPWFVGQERLRFETFAGWLINRNHWAALGIVLWPVALGWGLRGSSARRALGCVGAALVVTSVLATRSRAGLLVIGAQAIALGLFFVVRSRGRARAIVGAVMLAGAVAAVSQLGRWTARIGAGDVADRADIYEATARMALDSPILGFGPGTFRAAFPAYQPANALYSYSHAHNDPLEWWAGGGVLGLVLVLGLAAAIVRGARDRRAAPRSRLLWTLAVGGCALATCVEFPLQIPAVRFVWLGVLFAGASRSTLEPAAGREADGANA